MARGDFKPDPRSIIRAHRATYVDARTGRRRPQDSIAMELVPLVIGIICFIFAVKVNAAAAVGMLTVAGLLSAFLFGLMLQLSDRAMDWAESSPDPGATTSHQGQFLLELAANAGYASIVSITVAVAFGVASATTGWTLRVSSTIGILLGAHLVLVLFMVMKRVYAITEERLRSARTGAGRNADPVT